MNLLLHQLRRCIRSTVSDVLAWAIVVFLLHTLSAPGARAESEEVILVCPPAFEKAIQPWVTARSSEGLKVTKIQPRAKASDLRDAIKQVSTKSTHYILLVGDTPIIGQPTDPIRQIPTLYMPTTVSAKWGSTASLSTDSLYGDFDGDFLPDAAVGRLPVDEPEQLQKWIARILARESSTNFGGWRSRLQLIGGIGGFGKVPDAAIETVTRTIVTTMLPGDTLTHISYASPGHRFCPSNGTFTDAVVNNYRLGSRFWVYAGHGQVTELDRVAPSLGGKAVLDRNSIQRLFTPAETAPIAILLACFTGACDAAQDSIAEQMVLRDGGPVAVFAGSRITMPYGNTTAAIGLLQGIFRQQAPRLGDAWRFALRDMHQENSGPPKPERLMVDALATLISPSRGQLHEERREHMLLYNLLGDPTLRLHHPKPLQIVRKRDTDTSNLLRVEVNSPVSGTLLVRVDHPVGGVPEGDPNETLLAKVETTAVTGQPSLLDLPLPLNTKGPIIIRATVAGNHEWASGHLKTIWP